MAPYVGIQRFLSVNVQLNEILLKISRNHTGNLLNKILSFHVYKLSCYWVQYHTKIKPIKCRQTGFRCQSFRILNIAVNQFAVYVLQLQGVHTTAQNYAVITYDCHFFFEPPFSVKEAMGEF